MNAFEEYALCPWEGATLPVGHVCVADSRVPCEDRREDGQVCGACDPCVAAQESDPRYRRAADDDPA